MTGSPDDCHITIIGAGPYGLSAAAYLRAAGKEVRVFGQPMSFWQDQMPRGMCLRSNWGASHIADPEKKLTLDAFCREKDLQFSKPIPLDGFVGYGQWFQSQAVPDLDRRSVRLVESDERGFRITLADGETFVSRRVVVAAGIQSFQVRPPEFDRVPRALASHSSEHDDLGKFSGRSVVIIGSGQSALESAALLREAGAGIEVICRRESLRWVGLHPRLHHLGLVSNVLYSSRDVGPAGISRLVAAPHVFRKFPRWIQNRAAYRAIRPAVAGWLKSRIAEIPISFGRSVVSAEVSGDQLRLKLNDGTERLVDHVLFATGYRVDIARYDFLAPSLMRNLKIIDGYPVLKRGLESSVAGLHILGKPAAYSFGPIVGFVSGTEFASTELLAAVRAADSNGHRKN
jgi:cation diffusion facilitator CzcD-associated flavoprotein CzcO